MQLFNSLKKKSRKQNTYWGLNFNLINSTIKYIKGTIEQTLKIRTKIIFPSKINNEIINIIFF